MCAEFMYRVAQKVNKYCIISGFCGKLAPTVGVIILGIIV